MLLVRVGGGFICVDKKPDSISNFSSLFSSYFLFFLLGLAQPSFQTDYRHGRVTQWGRRQGVRHYKMGWKCFLRKYLYLKLTCFSRNIPSYHRSSMRFTYRFLGKIQLHAYKFAPSETSSPNYALDGGSSSSSSHLTRNEMMLKWDWPCSVKLCCMKLI